MADRRIHMEILGAKGSTDINTKLITYFKCILTEFEEICASREFQLNVNWQVNSFETKS